MPLGGGVESDDVALPSPAGCPPTADVALAIAEDWPGTPLAAVSLPAGMLGAALLKVVVAAFVSEETAAVVELWPAASTVCGVNKGDGCVRGGVELPTVVDNDAVGVGADKGGGPVTSVE
jgi:hypothetical protein